MSIRKNHSWMRIKLANNLSGFSCPEICAVTIITCNVCETVKVISLNVKRRFTFWDETACVLVPKNSLTVNAPLV